MIRINKPECPNPTALATNYRHPDNKQALINASFGKCMYCESKITHVYFGDVEHIKPKATYPALEFDWPNLGFVCAKCNNAKHNKYDAGTPYINPYEEDPGDFIVAMGAILAHRVGNERAELTISDIALNRPELLEKRQTIIKSIGKAIDACMRTKALQLKQLALEELKAQCEEDKEYSFVIKSLFRLHNLV